MKDISRFAVKTMNAARQDDQEMDDEQPPELFIKFEAEEDPLQQEDAPSIPRNQIYLEYAINKSIFYTTDSAEERIFKVLKEISEEREFRSFLKSSM
ncbi:Hypothetical predicted protein [Drosophila guanche]|uniref:Uncharacterized protein n=1 Tax=Drosophila guanche TaxID=7266 RepID=A0A3B0JLX1_DROGU|nr:Hypothetical predicted protein [Drosophila guanche]